MFCRKCGANIPDRSAFCPRCGETVDPADRVSKFSINFILDKIKSIPPKILKIGGGVIAGVLAIVIISSIASSVSNGSERCIKNSYKAFEKQSASKILKCVPKDCRNDIMDSYDLSKKELEEAVDDYLDDYWVNAYGSLIGSCPDDVDDSDDLEIKLEFRKTEELTRKKIKNVKKGIGDFDSKFDVSDFNTDKIEKGNSVKIRIRVEEDGDKVDSATRNNVTFKYKGRWYSYDIVYFVMCAAYYES